MYSEENVFQSIQKNFEPYFLNATKLLAPVLLHTKELKIKK